MEIKDKNLYYVGGVVRDEILGLQSFDTDFCYEGNAIEFAKGLNVIKVNPNFGTVRILAKGKEVDIASTRIETYPKAGHLPVINKIGCSLDEDLKRRDFTINAMAKNTETGLIVDLFGGLDDIKTKKIRVLHNKSFIEDPTRILRALKFSVRFGFTLEETTFHLQEEYLKNINYDMSYHRLKKELKETFNLNKIEAYKLFIEQKIYKLLGEKQEEHYINSNIEKIINKYKPKHAWLVYLGQFDLKKFDLTKEEQEILEVYSELKGITPINDIESYKLFYNKPLEAILLYAISQNEQIAMNYLDNIADIKIQIRGNDLLKLGISQGEIYKEIFVYVMEQKILNPEMTKQDELAIIKERFL